MITGIPNSGKSEWIDALLCNLNKNNNWKFALCSMENQVRFFSINFFEIMFDQISSESHLYTMDFKVREHARKLLEKHIQKPFFDERYI